MTIARDKVTGRAVGQVVPTVTHTNAEGATLTYSAIPGTVRVLTAEGYRIVSRSSVRLEEIRDN